MQLGRRRSPRQPFLPLYPQCRSPVSLPLPLTFPPYPCVYLSYGAAQVKKIIKGFNMCLVFCISFYFVSPSSSFLSQSLFIPFSPFLVSRFSSFLLFLLLFLPLLFPLLFLSFFLFCFATYSLFFLFLFRFSRLPLLSVHFCFSSLSFPSLFGSHSFLFSFPVAHHSFLFNQTSTFFTTSLFHFFIF